MARVRAVATPSVSLFPFLSILACLAGAVVVMICILSIAQANRMGGRPKEEVALAQEFVRLEEQLKTQRPRREQLAFEITRDDETRQAMAANDAAVVLLQKQLDLVAKGEETSAALQKELELLVVQIDELAKNQPEMQAALAVLKKELADRGKKPDDLATPVVVQSSGGAVAAGPLFFAEASGGALIVHKSKAEKASIAADTIGADAQLDAWLQSVAATPSATLVFLVRADGWGAYLRGAGWAENNFKIKTAKLPLPGKGPVDLTQFDRFRK